MKRSLQEEKSCTTPFLYVVPRLAHLQRDGLKAQRLGPASWQSNHASVLHAEWVQEKAARGSKSGGSAEENFQLAMTAYTSGSQIYPKPTSNYVSPML